MRFRTSTLSENLDLTVTALLVNKYWYALTGYGVTVSFGRNKSIFLFALWGLIGFERKKAFLR
jgi:hypothetical protein